MNLTVKEIEILFDLVLRKLKFDEVRRVEFNIDEYWIVSSDEWVDFNNDPTPNVGSLIEDITYLKRAIVENAIYTYSDLDRLSTVLRAISEIQAPINGKTD